MSILDTLVNQAKSGFSRPLLLAGGIPAILLLCGIKLVNGGLSQLQQDLLALLKTASPELTATGLVSLLVVLFASGVFFVARTLTLRTLQAVPGRPLSLVRRHLLTTQVERWWMSERRVRQSEARLTPLIKAADLDFAGGGLAASAPTDGRALERSRAARALVQRLAARDQKGWFAFEATEVDVVVDGLTALFALPPDDGQREGAAWSTLAEQPAVRDVIKRMAADAFRETRAATQDRQQHPDDERWLTPTRLGNRVAALDDYAEQRYGIDTGSLWLRLWGILTADERNTVSGAQLGLETLSNIAFVFLLLSGLVLVGAAGQLIAGLRLGRAVDVAWPDVLLFLAFVTLARIAYNACVFAFETVAERVVRLVDLRRLHLLTALGYDAPKTVDEERQMWSELRGFFATADRRLPTRPLTVPPPPAASRAADTKADDTPAEKHAKS